MIKAKEECFCQESSTDDCQCYRLWYNDHPDFVARIFTIVVTILEVWYCLHISNEDQLQSKPMFYYSSAMIMYNVFQINSL